MRTTDSYKVQSCNSNHLASYPRKTWINFRNSDVMASRACLRSVTQFEPDADCCLWCLWSFGRERQQFELSIDTGTLNRAKSSKTAVRCKSMREFELCMDVKEQNRSLECRSAFERSHMQSCMLRIRLVGLPEERDYTLMLRKSCTK